MTEILVTTAVLALVFALVAMRHWSRMKQRAWLHRRIRMVCPLSHRNWRERDDG